MIYRFNPSGVGKSGPLSEGNSMKQIIIKRLIKKSQVIKGEAEKQNNKKGVQDMEEFITLLEMLERTKDE
jgi:hypothetical protein